MNSVLITFRKEIRSILRDKKTLFTLFVFPIFIPIIIFLYGYMFDNLSDEIYVIGIDYDVNNIETSLLSEAKLDVINYDSIKDMKDAYDNGDIYGYIDYNEEDKVYTVYANLDSSDGMSVSSYINAYLMGYNDYLKELYLIGEDVDIEKANNNFSIESVNLEGENYLLVYIFNIAFTYIIMSIVMSATNMATSATAVEKENGTMETLLTFPIKVKNLVIGKYLATAFIGFVSSLFGFILTIISLFIATSYFKSFNDLEFSFSFENVILAIVIVGLASLFIAGVSILLTSRTKSFKEAQSVSSVFSLIAVMPMMISLMDVSINSFYYLIPICNHTQILMDLFSGIGLIQDVLLVIFSSLVYIVIVIYFVIKRYKVEEVLF